MVNNLVIEEMKVDDIDGVFEVEKSCFEDYWSKDSFKKELSNNLAKYLVAKVDGKIAGYVGIWFVVDEGHITNVAVHEDYRGKKIGDKLINELVQVCKDNKIVSKASCTTSSILSICFLDATSGTTPPNFLCVSI